MQWQYTVNAKPELMAFKGVHTKGIKEYRVNAAK